jgi:hypothetical protein
MHGRMICSYMEGLVILPTLKSQYLGKILHKHQLSTNPMIDVEVKEAVSDLQPAIRRWSQGFQPRKRKSFS